MDVIESFVAAAIADGWTLVEESRGCLRLEKPDPIFSHPGTIGPKGPWILMCWKIPSWQSQRLSIWAPDGLQITVPDVYDWAAIQERVRYCEECKRSDVDTFRYSFAGRACEECLPALKAEHERPGWTN